MQRIRRLFRPRQDRFLQLLIQQAEFAVDGSEIPSGIFMGVDITAAALVAGDVVNNPVIYSGLKFDAAKLVFDNGNDTLATLTATGRTIRAELELMDLVAQTVDVTTNFENA